MQTMTKMMAVGAVMAGLCGVVQASDMNGVVAYSLGEFDRVGTSQASPKSESGKMQKKSDTKLAQGSAAQHREMNAQKAEFVRRMFWMALSMR